jgi:hypothetical protein
MTINFESAGPAVTEEMVDAFEATLPGPLPADYRQFLLTQNGGDPEPNWWPPEISRVDFGARHFLGLGDVGYSYSLVRKREIFSDRLPAHELVIATDDGGALVHMSLAEESSGRIVFYNPTGDFEDEQGQLIPAPLVPVSDSFTALLDGLEPQPDLEERARRLEAAGYGGGGSIPPR